MSQYISIKNNSINIYELGKHIIKPYSLMIIKLNYSADNYTKYKLKGITNGKNLRFKLNVHGSIVEQSSKLTLDNLDTYINIDKSVGNSTGFYWNDTNVSPVYMKKNTRLIIDH